MTGYEVLTASQMNAADALAIGQGQTEQGLMEAAGFAVALAIRKRFRKQTVAVMCGPGKNGGDGYVVADFLRLWGWPVEVFSIADPIDLDLQKFTLIVDGLFGSGLSRPLSQPIIDLADRCWWSGVKLVAIDLPSGVASDSGEPLGGAFQADLTITFFRKKPAHLLYPAKSFCGEIVVADIGIPHSVLSGLGINLFENNPALWRSLFPLPQAQTHKYQRGHAVIMAGTTTGAARLAARAARRMGAGLVTIAAPSASIDVYRGADSGNLVESIDLMPQILQDHRKKCFLIGPGSGISEHTRHHVLACLAAGKNCILDADALTSFADDPRPLFDAIKKAAGVAILTPHDGEFAKLFPQSSGNRLERARFAAQLSSALIVLKGPDSVVACPDGRAIINNHASPVLATAGSGDSLAGMILGLMAQAMPVFEAAAAAIFLHGQIGLKHGLGLIAEDIADLIPHVLSDLFLFKDHS